jgi:SAM-dependent methyltransferase
MRRLARVTGFSEVASPAPAAVVPPQVPEPDPFALGLNDARLNGWWQHETNFMYHDFEVSAHDVVVDIGCGNGGIASYCAQRGAELILVDIDAQKIEATRQRLATSNARSVTTHVGDAMAIPVADATATRVVCTEVVEHVDDPAQVLRELVRIGKPGAVYLITVPDGINEDVMRPFAPKECYEKPNHIHIFDRTAFRTLVDESGLEVISHTTNGFFWAMWWSLFWLSGQKDLKAPWHPVLNKWTETWQAVLELPNGALFKQSMEQAIAKAQIIVARKP